MLRTASAVAVSTRSTPRGLGRRFAASVRQGLRPCSPFRHQLRWCACVRSGSTGCGNPASVHRFAVHCLWPNGQRRLVLRTRLRQASFTALRAVRLVLRTSLPPRFQRGGAGTYGTCLPLPSAEALAPQVPSAPVHCLCLRQRRSLVLRTRLPPRLSGAGARWPTATWLR